MAENSPVLESIHILNEPQVDNTYTFFSSLLLNPSPISQASLSEQWRYQVTTKLPSSFPVFNVFKDGRVELLWSDLFQKMPPSHDLITGVKSKDVIISTEPQVSTRIFLPELKTPDENSLSCFIFMGPGGFVMFSAFDARHHVLCNTILLRLRLLWSMWNIVSSRPDLYLHATRTRGRRSSGWLRMLMGVALSRG
jgi:hypothetical protein